MPFYGQGFFLKSFLKQKRVPPPQESAQGHTTTKRTHAEQNSNPKKSWNLASLQGCFSMGTLVPKYRFVNSSLISAHFTNGMVRRSFPMAQATGTICFCESSSQLVHAHRDPFPLPSFRFFAVCTTWPPTLESGWNSHLNKLASCAHCRCQFTSEFPVLRFAQFGLHIRNLKGSRLQAGRPTVHILCHSLPGFRFCGLCNMASTCAI